MWEPIEGDKSARYCRMCNTSMIETYIEKFENCKYTEGSLIEFYKDGILLFEYEETYTYDRHNYEYTSNFLGGDTCLTGVEIISTCIDCGHIETNTYYHHELMTIYSLDTAVVGCCSYHYFEVYECACGERLEYYTDINECVCGFKVIDSGNSNSDGCTHFINSSFKAVISSMIAEKNLKGNSESLL